MALGKVLVAVGLLIAAAGALVWLGVPLGRLPGDVLVRRGAFTFYVPVTTAVLASIVITIVLALLKR
ncbi:MAG: DUF2905 domain-containing protein [Vicinamibacterales bacterium]|nr:DUF2905 domain-containing protein [Vicinamibacterales bacterium]